MVQKIERILLYTGFVKHVILGQGGGGRELTFFIIYINDPQLMKYIINLVVENPLLDWKPYKVIHWKFLLCHYSPFY